MEKPKHDDKHGRPFRLTEQLRALLLKLYGGTNGALYAELDRIDAFATPAPAAPLTDEPCSWPVGDCRFAGQSSCSADLSIVELLREARSELRLVSATPKAMDHLPLTGPAIERLIPRIDTALKACAGSARQSIAALCSECHGSGRTDNHVTGEVECGHCKGSGMDPVDGKGDSRG